MKNKIEALKHRISRTMMSDDDKRNCLAEIDAILESLEEKKEAKKVIKRKVKNESKAD